MFKDKKSNQVRYVNSFRNDYEYIVLSNIILKQMLFKECMVSRNYYVYRIYYLLRALP